MKKSVSVLFAALLPALAVTTTLTATSAMAHDNKQEHCYPLAHGEEGLGSRNTMYVPYMRASGAEWDSVLYVRNISHSSINIKIKLRLPNGDLFIPSTAFLGNGFHEMNSPLDTESGGALLRPNNGAYLYISNDSKSSWFTAEISWQADKCISNVLVGALRVQLSGSSKYDQGLVLLNGGKPF